jgi:hypothetical protein
MPKSLGFVSNTNMPISAMSLTLLHLRGFLVLTEILAERKKAKEKLEQEARLGFGIGTAIRYTWNALIWVVLMILVGVALVVYTTVKILFGSMGR